MQRLESPWTSASDLACDNNHESEDLYVEQMRRVSKRIRVRIGTIRDEYSDKVRDCTMRLDGIDTITKWVRSPSKLIGL
jgi:RNase P subunit RPR2